MNQTVPVIVKNVKFRLREPQQFLFIFGFPIMFIAIFYTMFSGMKLENSTTMFDSYIWGLVGFIVAFAVQSAAVAFSQEKGKGTLKRLQTTPVGSGNSIFLGFILSEIIVVALQLLLIYVIAFALIGTYIANPISLIETFVIYLILSISCIGVGLMMAAILSDKLASQMPMILIMPFVFLSGAIMPIDSDIIYVNPLFWAHQLASNIGYYGKDPFTETITLFNFTTQVSKDTGIPIILGLPIVILFGLFFLLAGLILFKKRLD
jgi:ABC-type multidrug transport system permease subunit